VAATASFFEHQQLARRSTRIMVVLFLLAVAAIVVAVDAVFGLAYAIAFEEPPGDGLMWGALATAAVILVVSAVNVAKLAGGGEAVAKMLGARRVASNTAEPLERRLLNVVEEMSIAAGVRVPAVYVMDAERGINAFAAGWDVSSTVVAVTRGTLEKLTRDELQGVIGHEFSHIVNGDMRLNVRMIGVLAGIVFIGSIGQFLMRGSAETDDIRGVVALFTFGLLVFLVGYIGLFFARLIKAAVSRQREFLADASSVQFTRNPDGIAGALDQIGNTGSGALVSGRYAEELSHMFFGQGIKVWLGGLFDTHPPIDERIRRVNPGFQRVNYRNRRGSAAAGAESAAAAGASGFASGDTTAAPPAGRRNADVGAVWGRSAGDSAKLVGSLDGAKVDYAARLLASLPAGLRECLREPEGARAALVALLLAPKDDVMREQLQALRAAGLGTLADSAAVAAAMTRGLGPAHRLPVVDLALPAAKAAPEAARKELLAALEAVVYADRRITVHEFVVLTLVRSQLAPAPKPPAGGRKLAEMRDDVSLLLSLIAHAGTRPDAAGARAESLDASMRAGAKEMDLPPVAVATQLSLDAARASLEALRSLAPLQKARLVKGLFAAVLADGTIRVAEAELMRLVGAVLDCPLPPLLDDFSSFS